jgi:cobalt-zinc-cadmium efflux system protein
MVLMGGIGMFVANSMALVSDAMHMSIDAAVSFGSIYVVGKRNQPAQGQATFGFKRYEVRFAEWNGLLFFVLAAILGYGSIVRLLYPEHVGGQTVFFTALASLPISALVLWCLESEYKSEEHDHDGHKSLAVDGAFRHALTDLYGVLATITGGAIIWWTGWVRVDALASLLVVASLLKHGQASLKQTGWILLEKAPRSVNLSMLGEYIAGLPEVDEVLNLHVWNINSEISTMSVHVVMQDEGKCHHLQREIDEFAKRRFDISHCTIQVSHQNDMQPGRKAME